MVTNDVKMAPTSNVDQLRTLTREIAHDLGNLLQAISCCSWQLVACLPDESPLRRFAITIRDTATTCAQVTLSLKTLDEPSLRQHNSIDLNTVVQDAELLLRGSIPSETCLQIVPSPEVTRVEAHSGDVERIVINLATNALEAMEGSGQLTIKVENSDAGPEGQQHLGASAGGYGKIVVQDTGAGMDQDTLTRIFEPSFSTKAPSTGRGLGLASVQSVVRRIGGHIEVDSTPGVGTTFNVFLPKSPVGPRLGST